jgi:adenylate cyclase class IV
MLHIVDNAEFRIMIEFELKFRISRPPSELDNFIRTDESTIEDIYYDTSDFRLFKSGNFLRIRNNKTIDFKLNIGDNDHLYCKETNFLIADINSSNTDFVKLSKSLNIITKNQDFNSFQEFIDNNNLIILSPIIKKRATYKIDATTTIAIDYVEALGTFMEAEMLFDDSYQIDKHRLRDELISKLKKLGIYENDYQTINIGYVELYLLEKNKPLYELGKYKK